jgi:hypothetical protein
MIRSTTITTLMLILNFAMSVKTLADDEMPAKKIDILNSEAIPGWSKLSLEDKVAIAKNRPGDRFAIWYAGVRNTRVEDAEAEAKSFGLTVESYDVLTETGQKEFFNMIPKCPELRIKLVEVGTIYGQRGWKLRDGTILWADPQEFNVFVPMRDTAWLFIMATTEPPGGREAALNKVLTKRAADRERAKAKTTKPSQSVPPPTRTDPKTPADSPPSASSAPKNN